MSILIDIKTHGVERHTIITCTNNLNGFTDTIKTVFPQAATQICVVHLIRNACRYVVWEGHEGVHIRYEGYLCHKSKKRRLGSYASEDKW